MSWHQQGYTRPSVIQADEGCWSSAPPPAPKNRTNATERALVETPRQPWPTTVRYGRPEDCTPEMAATLIELMAGLSATSGAGGIDNGATSAADPIGSISIEPATLNVVYQCLDSSGTTMRLLRISPGKAADPLHGTLDIADLQSPPQYDALSYTWADDQGDKSLREHILLGPEQTALPITFNCSAALRNLRKEDSDVVLWVDSVCINQKADNERSHQVGLMGRIYSLARSVLIYVGEDVYRGRKVGERIMDAIDHIWYDQWVPNSTRWGQEKMHSEFQDFFARAYFSRVWIIQEIALAKEAWVICGSWRLNWTSFDLQQSHSLEVKNYFPSWIPHVLGGPRERNLKEFAELLVATSTCQASDPRDKVFGLLGLSQEASELGLAADYSRSPREIYIGTAALLVQRGFLDIVCSAAAVTNRAMDTSAVPSWVPLWNHSTFTPLETKIHQLKRMCSSASTDKGPILREKSDPLYGAYPDPPGLRTVDLQQLAPHHFLMTSGDNSSDHPIVHYETGALLVKAVEVIAPGGFDNLGLEQPALAWNHQLRSRKTDRVLLAFDTDQRFLPEDSIIAIEGSGRLMHVRGALSGVSKVRKYQLLGPCIIAVVPHENRGVSYYLASPRTIRLLFKWQRSFGYREDPASIDGERVFKEGTGLFEGQESDVEAFLLCGGELWPEAQSDDLESPEREALRATAEFWSTVLLGRISEYLSGFGEDNFWIHLSGTWLEHLDHLGDCAWQVIQSRRGTTDSKSKAVLWEGDSDETYPIPNEKNSRNYFEAQVRHLRDMIKNDLARLEPLQGLRLDYSEFETRRPGEKYSITLDLLDTLDIVETDLGLVMDHSDIMEERTMEEVENLYEQEVENVSEEGVEDLSNSSEARSDAVEAGSYFLPDLWGEVSSDAAEVGSYSSSVLWGRVSSDGVGADSESHSWSHLLDAIKTIVALLRWSQLKHVCILIADTMYGLPELLAECDRMALLCPLLPRPREAVQAMLV